MKFIPIRYNDIDYPSYIKSEINETAGHLDKDKIEIAGLFSLHTEYSYGKRLFNSSIIQKYNELTSSNKDGIPQLWKSTNWAEEFAEFIFELTDGKEPYIIEIHPPFNDYSNLQYFLDCYKVFENKIHAKYPSTIIVVENRSGSLYRGGRFVLGKTQEIVEFCKLIKEQNINLGVVLDFPQLLTAEHLDTLKFDKIKFNSFINQLIPCRQNIKGIHIWAKKKSEKGRWVAHCGTFETYFDGNTENMNCFINGIKNLCDDNVSRFLVPEVNSGQKDLFEIIKYFIQQ